MTSEQLGAEDDVTGLVDAVHVAERRGDREHGADGAQGLVHVVNLEKKLSL